jgi:TctA family transporter
MVPFLLFLCFLGAFTSNNHYGDLIVLMIFGGIGYILMRCEWPRPPFILGFILGRVAEINLFAATLRYGAHWLYRPKVLTIFLITVAFALTPAILKKRNMRNED